MMILRRQIFLTIIIKHIHLTSTPTTTAPLLIIIPIIIYDDPTTILPSLHEGSIAIWRSIIRRRGSCHVNSPLRHRCRRRRAPARRITRANHIYRRRARAAPSLSQRRHGVRMRRSSSRGNGRADDLRGGMALVLILVLGWWGRVGVGGGETTLDLSWRGEEMR